MTRAGPLTAAVAIGLAVSAQAETPSPVWLSAGDDAGASGRLVLEHWPASGWSVQQFQRFVEIRLPDTELDISPETSLAGDLEGSLQEVGTEIRDGDTYIRLTLACDCEVAVRGSQEARLVFDIVDPAPDPADSIEATGPAPLTAPLPKAKPVTNVADASPAAMADAPSAAGAEDAGAAADGGEVDAKEARRRLMEQLLRAADAGFVELRPEPGEDAPGDAQQPAAEAEAQDVPAAAAPEAADGDRSAEETDAIASEADQVASDDTAVEKPEHAGVGSEADQAASERPADADIKTAPETEAASAEEQVVATAPEPRCFGNLVFAFPDVDRTGNLAAEIGDLRRRLTGEFDRSDPDVAVDLARLYIAAGFGVEARAVISAFAPDADAASVLTDIALLIDGRVPPAESSLRRKDCIGDQALWRALAHAADDDAEAALRDEAASGRALERVPAPLRQSIAVRLGMAAADAGDWDAARRLEAMAERAGASVGRVEGPRLLLSARLADWHDEEERARSLLREARTSDQESAAAALLRQAEHALRAEALTEAGTAPLREDVGAMARERRGTETGAAAFELEAELLSRVASHDEVVDLISHGVAAGLYPEESHVALLSRLVREPALDERDQPLALVYSADPERFAAALEQLQFRHALVRSMAETGLPRLAGPVLRQGDLDDPELAAALAQAFLDGGEPREAMEIAAGLPDGPARHRLLGDALMATGQADQAKGHFASAARPGSVPDAERLRTLERQIEASLADGDAAAALEAAERQLGLGPSAERAERVALLALEAGRAAIPDAAADVLRQSAPGRLSALEALFRRPVELAEEPAPEAVAAYLEQLDAEMKMIEDFLNDG